VNVEGFVNVLGGDLAELKLASHPGIGENDVEGSALGLHCRVESVEVGLIRDRALHRAGVGPEVGHSGVELFLPAAEDEDEGALLDEALCRGEADASSSTGDHGGLSIQSGQLMHPSLELYGSRDLLVHDNRLRAGLWREPKSGISKSTEQARTGGIAKSPFHARPRMDEAHPVCFERTLSNSRLVASRDGRQPGLPVFRHIGAPRDWDCAEALVNLGLKKQFPECRVGPHRLPPVKERLLRS
jgi:hypothetical protein